MSSPFLETAALPSRHCRVPVRFRDLGEHKLAGLPKRERLFQIDAPGQRTAFPPLRV